MGRITRRLPSRRIVTVTGRPDHVDDRVDTVAVEEPLEIRVDGRPVAVTMRTPGHDFDLTLGWLHAEGHVTAAQEVLTLMHCQDTDADGSPTFNVVDVTPAQGTSWAITPRAATTTSACGMCGAASIDATRRRSRYDLRDDAVRLDASWLAGLPDRLQAAQRTFDRTGGTHAAGLFDTGGELLVAREDVGRHNAVDKVVGWALREGRLPLRRCVLVVSGRAGYELVQKAVLAGAPAMVSVSATTSLAVDLARASGLTLASFVRGDRLTLYNDPGRVAP